MIPCVLKKHSAVHIIIFWIHDDGADSRSPHLPTFQGPMDAHHGMSVNSHMIHNQRGTPPAINRSLLTAKHRQFPLSASSKTPRLTSNSPSRNCRCAGKTTHDHLVSAATIQYLGIPVLSPTSGFQSKPETSRSPVVNSLDRRSKELGAWSVAKNARMDVQWLCAGSS
jgi:hypothetical protein